MPWGALTPIGIGGGAAAANQDNLAQQTRQQDFMLQLLQHAQQMQALQGYRQSQLQQNELIKQQMADAAKERAATGASNMRLTQLSRIAPGNEVSNTLAQTPEAVGQVQEQQTLPSRKISGWSAIPGQGGASTGETQVQTSPSQPSGRFLKVPSDKDTQQSDLMDLRKLLETDRNQRQSDTNDLRRDLAQQGNDLRTQLAANRGGPTVVVQTVDENGKPVTKIVPKTAGASYARPVGATLEGRLASAQAVNQTGNDIIQKVSDPVYAKTLGPVMGRYGSLRDFIGNPPPEYSELAGNIESYALASMGVHGMRSSQGAEKIAQLLNQKHTPESLAATIRGLNNFSTHFMQNEGRGAQLPTAALGGGTKPTAEELIKKYGGQ